MPSPSGGGLRQYSSPAQPLLMPHGSGSLVHGFAYETRRSVQVSPGCSTGLFMPTGFTASIGVSGTIAAPPAAPFGGAFGCIIGVVGLAPVCIGLFAAAVGCIIAVGVWVCGLICSGAGAWPGGVAPSRPHAANASAEAHTTICILRR